MVQSAYRTLRLIVIAIIGIFMVDALAAMSTRHWPDQGGPSIAPTASEQAVTATRGAAQAPTLGRFVVTAHGSEFIAADQGAQP